MIMYLYFPFFQAVNIDTPHIKENVLGIFAAVAKENTCIGLLGLCAIPAIKSKCAPQCAVYAGKNNPCADVTPEDAKKRLCSIFDPDNPLIKLGFTSNQQDKTCTGVHACNMAVAGGSLCKKECDALKKKCQATKAVITPQCSGSTTATGARKH